jgi:DNA-binding MarR family transcriptional regulator
MHSNLDPRARELMLAARRFSRSYAPYSSLFTELGLRHSEIFPLVMLRKAGGAAGLKPSDLAAHLGVTAGNVTQMMTALETRGLVLRAPDPEDGRAVRLRLTEAGEGAMEAAEGSWAEAFSGLLGELGAEDCERLTLLLEKASDYFKRLYGADHASHFGEGRCHGRPSREV